MRKIQNEQQQRFDNISKLFIEAQPSKLQVNLNDEPNNVNQESQYPFRNGISFLAIKNKY